MAEVHPRQAVAHHALMATVIALIAALIIGAGAVVLYYEVIDSDTVLVQQAPAPVVSVVTPEQVAAARAMKDEARIAAGTSVAPAAAGTHPTAARTEGIGTTPNP